MFHEKYRYVKNQLNPTKKDKHEETQKRNKINKTKKRK